jgi:hypothetical protein
VDGLEGAGVNGIYRVKIRTGPRWPDCPNAELVEGKTFRFRFGWQLTHEMGGRFAMEAAMVPMRDDPAHPYPEMGPPWLSIGDLERADETAPAGDLVEQATR